jgi:hypothetical protein
MPGSRWIAAGKATVQMQQASVQSMSSVAISMDAPDRDRVAMYPRSKWTVRALLAVSVSLLLQVWLLTPPASAAGIQSNAAPAPTQAGTASPAISDSLRPALEQVGHSVGQIQIDHWKIPKNWKEQLQGDADSISNDLSHQLPDLLQQAQASPTALDVQIRLMQNVGALYDVLVRLTLAADMNEKKNDAALLDSALERLEAARKTATAALMSTAAQQHQQLTQLQEQVAASQVAPNASSTQGKTIVVDNELKHGTVHHTTPHHKKPSPSTSAKPQQSATPPPTDKPTPQ